MSHPNAERSSTSPECEPVGGRPGAHQRARASLVCWGAGTQRRDCTTHAVPLGGVLEHGWEQAIGLLFLLDLGSRSRSPSRSWPYEARPLYSRAVDRIAPFWLALAAGWGCWSCHDTEELVSSGATPSASVAPSSSPASTSGRPPRDAPLANEMVEVPGGTFRAGSRPGKPHRDPRIEPRPYDVELGPFRIDKLPYPNDPAKAPLTGISRMEAQRRCAERGTRLCTELEWERACKGADQDEYPGGTRWDPRCATSPARCASGFDVLGLGATLREWTASDVRPTKRGAPVLAAVRGAKGSAAAGFHRCAHRDGADPQSTAEDLGFRCCGGAPNAAKVNEPTLGQTFRKVSLKAQRLEQLLASSSRTKSLAHDVMFFREPEAAHTVVARGPGDTKGFSFTVSPMIWNPVAGAEILLVSARAGEDTTFVVAYHVVAKDEYSLAASFVMKNEPGPVAFAYSQYIRPRLHFSNCWGCLGETGKILFRDPDTVAILQP